jgi:hypothetical protein
MKQILVSIHLFLLTTALVGAAEDARIMDDPSSWEIIQMVQRSDLFNDECGTHDAQSTEDLLRLEAMDRAKIISVLKFMLQHPDEVARKRSRGHPQTLNANAIYFLERFQVPPLEILPLLRARLITLADDLREANDGLSLMLLRDAEALIHYLVLHGDREDMDAVADVAGALAFHGSPQAIKNGNYIRWRLDLAIQDTPRYERGMTAEIITRLVCGALMIAALALWQERHLTASYRRKPSRQDLIESLGI